MVATNTHADDIKSARRVRLTATAAASLALSTLLLLSAWASENRLGAPTWWAWLLTGLQVVALWAAGARRWWGWLLGASVQPPWIAYALVTGQLGFVPGCLVSCVVQVASFLRRREPELGTETPASLGAPVLRLTTPVA